MKSLEELEQMSMNQLRSIATQLGVGVKGKTPKADLVMTIYNIQQPEAPSESKEPKEEVKKPINTKKLIEAERDRLEDFFGGKLEECGETEDKIKILKIIDGEREITRGTFQELVNAMQDGDKIIEELDAPIKDPSLPAIENGDILPGIEESLEALSLYGLSYSIEGSVVNMRVGSKQTCCTLNQPAHRVVRTAEVLCNRV